MQHVIRPTAVLAPQTVGRGRSAASQSSIRSAGPARAALRRGHVVMGTMARPDRFQPREQDVPRLRQTCVLYGSRSHEAPVHLTSFTTARPTSDHHRRERAGQQRRPSFLLPLKSRSNRHGSMVWHRDRPCRAAGSPPSNTILLSRSPGLGRQQIVTPFRILTTHTVPSRRPFKLQSALSRLASPV